MKQKTACLRRCFEVVGGVLLKGRFVIRGIKVGPTARDPE